MRFWNRRREDRELAEELRFHLEQERKLRVERGQDPAGALRDFGNVTHTFETAREAWAWSSLERAAQDARFALRMMRKNVAFTALALCALALGIGATTAIFSVVNSVLLRPLRFPAPDRLVMVWELPPHSAHNNVVQTGNFLDWRKRNHSFEDIAAFLQLGTNVESGNGAVQVPGVIVTPGFFEILGVPPMLGRAIRAEDSAPGAPNVTVLSYEFWQRWFGGRPDAIGHRMTVGSSSTEVIGILPPGFRFPTMPRAALYVPLTIDPVLALRDGRNYSTVARLRRGVSLASAVSDMQSLAAQLAAERPYANANWSANVVPLMEQTIGDSRTTLLVLMGAVFFVLLIACANVANLLLMRNTARRREMTVRIALGAGRWRLLHQLAIESLLLSLAGGALGFLLALWGVPALLRMLPAEFPLPRRGEIAVDPAALGFTFLASLACGLFFGMFPALQVNRARTAQGLRASGRHGSVANRAVRNSLVVVEIALALLLVVGAGLMVRSFLTLHAVNPGFRTDQLLAFRMMLLTPANSFEQVMTLRAARVQQMLDRIRALPDVASASSIHLLPMTGMQSGTGYYRADRPAPPPGSGIGGDVSIISTDYFRTMGIRMLAGREFDEHDRAGAPNVVILNQAAAQKFYPGENPIGKRMFVQWGRGPNDVEIVGVSADIRHNGLDNLPLPCVFLPQNQKPSGFASLLVRGRGAPANLINEVKQQVRAVSPSQGIQDIETMDAVLSDSIARPKLEAAILSIFAAVALVLACVGIYAVISYSVQQRTREMGIRLALGAAPGAILSMVLREGVLLAVAGIAAGLAAALMLTRYLSSLLYTVRPTDPSVYAAVSALLAAAAMAGCFVPARRATRVDPAVVLRDE